MDYKWILVAALLGFAGASPRKPHRDAEEVIKIFQTTELGRNSALENLILEALEDLRQIMVTGNDDIPVLDPLHVEQVFVDDSTIPIEGARVELKDLVVSQLSTFDMTELSVTSVSLIPVRYRAQFTGEVPNVDVNVGFYDFLIDVAGLDLFGKGDAKIIIKRPWVKVDTTMNLRYGFLAVYLNIMNLRIDFGLDDIQFGITGMFNNPTVDNFVNLFLRNLILEFVDFWMDDISAFISPEVQAVANDILADINLIGIIG